MSNHKSIYIGFQSAVKIFILASFLTAVFTWPFVIKISTYFPEGDHSLSASILWYNQKSILNGIIFKPAQYFQGYQMYPLPNTITYTDHFFIPSLIFSPIYWASNNLILSTNLFILMTFILTFMSCYFCLNYLIKNSAASIIGAIVFTFNPLTYSHFAVGHLHLINKYFLPPLFLYFYLFLKKPAKLNSFLVGLFYNLNFLSSSTLGIYSTITLIIIFLIYSVMKIFSKKWGEILNLSKNVLLVLVFFPFLLYFYLPYLGLPLKEKVNRELSENIYYSAEISDWLFSTADNFLYGNFVKLNEKNRWPVNTFGQFYTYQERTMFFNLVPFALLFLGIYHLTKKSHLKKPFNQNSALIFFNLFLLLFSAVLTLGPVIKLGSNYVRNLPLPFYPLYQLIPIMHAGRVPSRFQFIFYLPLAFFVSYGALFILNRIPKKQIMVFLLLSFLLFLENFNVNDYSLQSDILNSFNKEISQQELLFLRNNHTLHLPISKSLAKETEYTIWAVQTGEITFNGYSGFFPEDYLKFKRSLWQDVDEAALKKIYALGIDYLVIHKNLMGNKDLKKISALNLDTSAKKLDNKMLLVLDLKKFNFNIAYCSFPDDFKFNFETNVNPANGKNEQVLIMENVNDCFLSPKISRYQKILYGDSSNRSNVHIKLPILINPYEKVSLFSDSFNL